MSIPLHFVRHPRARRYVIRVGPDGSVRVTVPRWGSKRRAEDFVRQQQPWIEKQRFRVAERQRCAAVEYPPEHLDKLRARARKELIEELQRLASANGLKPGRVSVRNQRWRWGSCSPSGHICLNWRLILMPDFVREYVLIHELMHLRRLDHSAAFWKLVAEACPRLVEARAWLRRSHLLQ